MIDDLKFQIHVCTYEQLWQYIKLLCLRCFLILWHALIVESLRLSSISSVAALFCIALYIALWQARTQIVPVLHQDKGNQWEPHPQPSDAEWDRPGLQRGVSRNSYLQWVWRRGESYSGIGGVAVCPSPSIGYWTVLYNVFLHQFPHKWFF